MTKERILGGVVSGVLAALAPLPPLPPIAKPIPPAATATPPRILSNSGHSVGQKPEASVIAFVAAASELRPPPLPASLPRPCF